MNKLLEYGIKELKDLPDNEYLANYLLKYISDKSLYKEGIQKLKEGMPIQYVIGNVNFYGYDFVVNKNVLIPRFETEGLIEKTLKYIDSKKIKIADIGTGSGCIAITLKKELPDSSVTAVDISAAALEVAKLNALNNNCEIDFKEGNLTDPLKDKYDLIISNPPYIAYDEEIMEIVKNNEPSIALYASKNGLDNYIRILSKIKKNLNKHYLIAFEIGATQGNELKNIARRKFLFSKIWIEKDLQGKDRYLFIKK